MSAAQPKTPEPSMEEILASIRRIIADEPHKDGQAATPAEPASAPVAAPPAADDDDIMELTPKPKVRVQEPHLITDDPVDNDLSFAEPAQALPKSQDDIDALMSMEPEPEPQSAPVPEAPPPAPAPPPFVAPPAAIAAPALAQAPASAPDRLISAETDRVATTAFSSLANTVLMRNARTLDDLMQDMLRPMVKAWLDDNLPTVVERLVKAEIERVSRGGR